MTTTAAICRVSIKFSLLNLLRSANYDQNNPFENNLHFLQHAA